MKLIDRQGPYLIVRARLTGPFVKRGNSPNQLFPTLAGAVTEASRLSVLMPEYTWSIFECVGQVVGEKQLETSSIVAETPPVRETTAKKISKPKPKKAKAAA